MRKIILASIIMFVAAAAFGQSQSTNQATEAPRNMGVAPKEPNGIGRLDLRVTDENGNPINGADARLESTRTDGYFCESWASTDSRGVVALPPIHMGSLRLIVKARGYRKFTTTVPTSALAEPVRVALVKK